MLNCDLLNVSTARAMVNLRFASLFVANHEMPTIFNQPNLPGNYEFSRVKQLDFDGCTPFILYKRNVRKKQAPTAIIAAQTLLATLLTVEMAMPSN